MKPITCICCSAEWSGQGWNFYDLCERCFREFDAQKMKGRFAKYLAPGVEIHPYFENAVEWVKSRKKT